MARFPVNRSLRHWSNLFSIRANRFLTFRLRGRIFLQYFERTNDISGIHGFWALCSQPRIHPMFSIGAIHYSGVGRIRILQLSDSSGPIVRRDEDSAPTVFVNRPKNRLKILHGIGARLGDVRDRCPTNWNGTIRRRVASAHRRAPASRRHNRPSRSTPTGCGKSHPVTGQTASQRP